MGSQGYALPVGGAGEREVSRWMCVPRPYLYPYFIVVRFIAQLKLSRPAVGTRPGWRKGLSGVRTAIPLPICKVWTAPLITLIVPDHSFSII